MILWQQIRLYKKNTIRKSTYRSIDVLYVKCTHIFIIEVMYPKIKYYLGLSSEAFRKSFLQYLLQSTSQACLCNIFVLAVNRRICTKRAILNTPGRNTCSYDNLRLLKEVEETSKCIYIFCNFITQRWFWCSKTSAVVSYIGNRMAFDDPVTQGARVVLAAFIIR